MTQEEILRVIQLGLYRDNSVLNGLKLHILDFICRKNTNNLGDIIAFLNKCKEFALKNYLCNNNEFIEFIDSNISQLNKLNPKILT